VLFAHVKASNLRRTVRVKSSKQSTSAGFSLNELLIVVAIILVVAGMSLPSISRVIDNARLKSASQQLASLYQQARIRSTQDNTYYELLSTAPGVRPAQVCIDLDGDGACGATEPQIQLPLQVTLSNVGLPVVLDQATLGFSPIGVEGSVMYNQRDLMVPGLAWNSRGLPCQRTTTTSPCANLTPGGAVAWVQYLQMQRSTIDTSYAAVTVSPTGHVRTWSYAPASGGNRSWF
jgi:prepilin-type N-terminal cleavage/methylation domain-containing protein